MKSYIFGAKATAAGLYLALSALEPERRIEGFLVSGRDGNDGNPDVLWGRPVWTLDEAVKSLSSEERKEAVVYVAVPELIHEEIRGLLEGRGFCGLRMLDSREEAAVMERYYEKKGMFPSVHSLPAGGKAIGHVSCGNFSDHSLPDDEQGQTELPQVTVYAATFYKDRPLKHPPTFPDYIKKLYLGCEKARELGIELFGQADFFDDEGDQISAKNPNRCEMTAHYWIWKNRLHTGDEYMGVCHYRRMMDLGWEDLKRIRANDVDVVLPFPMIHYPDCRIQHTWYVPEKDWETMRNVLKELHPEDEAHFDQTFGQPYFYNYNMLLAKKQVFADYCAWLYPILDRIEEVSEPKGESRADRYTAYLSESLMTLYFMNRRENLRIYHTGRLLFT